MLAYDRMGQDQGGGKVIIDLLPIGIMICYIQKLCSRGYFFIMLDRDIPAVNWIHITPYYDYPFR